jgi:hypothetical protein
MRLLSFELASHFYQLLRLGGKTQISTPTACSAYSFVSIQQFSAFGLETVLTVLLRVWVPSAFSQKLGYLALIAQSR